MAKGVLAKVAKKYGVVIFFPTFTVATIYADWSHTRDWKQKQKEISKVKDLMKH